MTSKYKAKLAKPVTKQMHPLKELALRASKVYPVCTNCGTTSTLEKLQYSKCRCGGTFQSIKSTKE